MIFIKNSELRKIDEKLAMTSQFDLTRFYHVMMRNSAFYQIPLLTEAELVCRIYLFVLFLRKGFVLIVSRRAFTIFASPPPQAIAQVRGGGILAAHA